MIWQSSFNPYSTRGADLSFQLRAMNTKLFSIILLCENMSPTIMSWICVYYPILSLFTFFFLVVLQARFNRTRYEPASARSVLNKSQRKCVILISQYFSGQLMPRRHNLKHASLPCTDMAVFSLFHQHRTLQFLPNFSFRPDRIVLHLFPHI